MLLEIPVFEAFLGDRRDLVVEMDRPTVGRPAASSVVPDLAPYDHSSTMVCSHRHMFQQATLLHTLRTCCWPAPWTPLRRESSVQWPNGPRRLR